MSMLMYFNKVNFTIDDRLMAMKMEIFGDSDSLMGQKGKREKARL